MRPFNANCADFPMNQWNYVHNTIEEEVTAIETSILTDSYFDTFYNENVLRNMQSCIIRRCKKYIYTLTVVSRPYKESDNLDVLHSWADLVERIVELMGAQL